MWSSPECSVHRRMRRGILFVVVRSRDEINCRRHNDCSVCDLAKASTLGFSTLEGEAEESGYLGSKMVGLVWRSVSLARALSIFILVTHSHARARTNTHTHAGKERERERLSPYFSVSTIMQVSLGLSIHTLHLLSRRTQTREGERERERKPAAYEAGVLPLRLGGWQR